MRRLAQVALGVGAAVGLLLLTSQVAYADNCGGLTDCFGTTEAAIIAAVALGALVAAALLGGWFVLAAAGEAIADTAAEGLAAGAAEALEAAAGEAAIDAEAAAEAEASAAQAAETVTADRAVAEGLVNPGGKLFDVLQGIQDAYGSTPPQNIAQAMQIVQQVTGNLGLGAGTAVDAAETIPQGYVQFVNVGDVLTTILNTGEIIITKGGQVILHLFP